MMRVSRSIFGAGLLFLVESVFILRHSLGVLVSPWRTAFSARCPGMTNRARTDTRARRAVLRCLRLAKAGVSDFSFVCRQKRGCLLSSIYLSISLFHCSKRSYKVHWITRFGRAAMDEMQYRFRFRLPYLKHRVARSELHLRQGVTSNQRDVAQIDLEQRSGNRGCCSSCGWWLYRGAANARRNRWRRTGTQGQAEQ